MLKRIRLHKEKIFPLFPATVLFSILFLPFVGLVPYLDGDVEFLIAVNFYQGNYLKHWFAYHPPLKLFLSSIIFSIFGFSFYSLLGFFLGILGIVALYSIANTLFDRKTAIVSTLFLSLSGIYISAGIFSVNDFLLGVFILSSFAFYCKKKYTYAALLGCCAVLSKESGIIFPLSILLVEAWQRKFRFSNLFPFFALLGWFLFLHITGHTLWNSWNFSDSQQHGSFFTVLDNMLRGKIFNKYAYENWLHLFVFNYNWVFWIFAILSFTKFSWRKEFSVITLFTILYSLIILSFQTYSIPRYVLPILSFVYMFAAVQLTRMKWQFVFLPLVFVCLIISLLVSSDPISNKIWKKQQILNEQFYINKVLDGNDGITYNMQFLYLTQERDAIMRTKLCNLYKNSLFMSPKTITILNLSQCK